MRADTQLNARFVAALRDRKLNPEPEYPYLSFYSIDVAFPLHRIAIFVDGCLWHLCPIHFSTYSNHLIKLLEARKLQLKDLRITEMLRSRGWLVLRYWEHDVDDPEIFPFIVDEIVELVSVTPKSQTQLTSFV